MFTSKSKVFKVIFSKTLQIRSSFVKVGHRFLIILLKLVSCQIVRFPIAGGAARGRGISVTSSPGRFNRFTGYFLFTERPTLTGEWVLFSHRSSCGLAPTRCTLIRLPTLLLKATRSRFIHMLMYVCVCVCVCTFWEVKKKNKKEWEGIVNTFILEKKIMFGPAFYLVIKMPPLIHS